MKRLLRRRKIRRSMPSEGPDAVLELTIPLDQDAKDDQDAFNRHMRRLAKFDPIDLTEMMSTRLGRFLIGRVRIKGGGPNEFELLRKWEDIVPPKAGPLTDEQYAVFLRGGDPHAVVQPTEKSGK